MIGHIVGPGYGAPVVDNAINPIWRDGSSFSISIVNMPTNATLAEKAAAQKFLTDKVDGPLRAASPYGAAYVNEVSRNSFCLNSGVAKGTDDMKFRSLTR